MSKSGIDSKSIKNKLMQDQAFSCEYERLKPRYEMISLIISERKKQNMTQEDLAKRIGTKKSNISRLESGNYNPSLDFLIKIAEAFGKELTLTWNEHLITLIFM